MLPQFRRQKIGGALLDIAENQIFGTGHPQAKLRVVAENVSARQFFTARGWREGKIYPHEKWHFSMIDMSKNLGRVVA